MAAKAVPKVQDIAAAREMLILPCQLVAKARAQAQAQAKA